MHVSLSILAKQGDQAAMSRYLASTSVTAGTLSHEKLRKSPFFAECDDSFLTTLIKHLVVELFTTNDIIMEEGEVAEKMYYLMLGEVEILVGHDRVRVAKIQEGTVFGEMAMFSHLSNGFARRSATIRAVNFCDTRVINKDRFHAILKQHPNERARFERIAQERRASLEKTKSILRPEKELRPAASTNNAQAKLEALKQKALLGRRASLPVSWANPRASESAAAGEPKIPSVGSFRSTSKGRQTLDTSRALLTSRSFVQAAASQVREDISDQESTGSSESSGLSSDPDVEPVPAQVAPDLEPTKPQLEGPRPRAGSLLAVLRQVAWLITARKAERRKGAGAFPQLTAMHSLLSGGAVPPLGYLEVDGRPSTLSVKML
ncbi:Potassium/sodium hyperpolarization-activated cyclic nucleotide-gated channel 2 [Symbiodinium microadriaticum]|uniref:Potassium/sodium hyperpolarization-activated cyclic nucleotide-gated channel 2 n=1 Tax=Symbiodinium microadriaticum TaxID=2951 RepID=A0A1Q9CSV3_SYMMI|nr:Potassium/sodium hyperpolarization-activated cyclic nucleotide-gated channel 2 [Symbiodinium microadriaticum]